MRGRALFTLLFAPSIVLAWSCATDPEPDRVAEIDPNIPEVDASWTPTPKPPQREPEPVPSPQPAPPDASEPAPRLDPGPDRTAQRAAAGEIVLTEVMYDPLGTEPASEWLEVWNGASSARSLAGLTLHDGADRTHTIASHVVVPPGAYVVLARSRDAAVLAGVPASAIVYEYGVGLGDSQGVLLANGASGAVGLFDGAQELTRCAYGGYAFADASGRSAQLDATSSWSDAGTWCSAAPTPGAAGACATR